MLRPSTHRVSSRCRRALAALLLQSVCLPWAGAQAPPPGGPPVGRPAPSADGKTAAVSPAALVQLFLEACVAHDGRTDAVIDWALGRGFEPLDPSRSGAEGLLGGSAGTVLAKPGGAGAVLLAAAQDQRCLVWAEQTHGPQLRSAFQRMVASLGVQGARLRNMIDRNVNSGGTWRNQSQWRYRRSGGEVDFGLGSATTLLNAPGAQLLHFVPLAFAATPARDAVAPR